MGLYMRNFTILDWNFQYLVNNLIKSSPSLMILLSLLKTQRNS